MLHTGAKRLLGSACYPGMTTFHLQADALDLSFLEKLKSLFAHKEIDIFVRESASNGDYVKGGRADGISRLLVHPIGVKNFQAPSKEEIYSRQ